MIDSVGRASTVVVTLSGAHGAMGMGPIEQVSLTSDQVSQVQDILSQYDAASITADDAHAINQALSDAGIRPGQALRETIESAGFDAEKLRTLGPPPGSDGRQRRPAPPRATDGDRAPQGVDVQTLSTLKGSLNNHDLERMNSEDQQRLFGELRDAGLMSPGMMIELKA